MACQHIFAVSDREGYEQCIHCRSYHSTQALPPEDIYRCDYWGAAWGHSTLQEQVYNVDVHEEGGKTKTQFVLDRIQIPQEERKVALEIACAPGSLLKRLKEDAGFLFIVGVETCREWEPTIHETAGAQVTLR